MHNTLFDIDIDFDADANLGADFDADLGVDKLSARVDYAIQSYAHYSCRTPQTVQTVQTPRMASLIGGGYIFAGI